MTKCFRLSFLFPLVPAVLFAGLSASALADPMPTGVVATDAVVRQNQDVTSPQRGYDCSPKPIGSGTWPTIRSNSAGTVAWWYCQSASGEWRVDWAVATAEQLKAHNVLAQLRQVLVASDRHAAFDKVVNNNVKVPLDAPSLTAVWHPFIAEMNAGKPVVLPVAKLAPLPGQNETVTASR